MVDDSIKVGIWQHLTGSTWARVGGLKKWTGINMEWRHLQSGPWTLTAPITGQSGKLGEQALVTFDFRGQRFTGVPEHIGLGWQDNGVGIEVSGSDASSLLGDPLCWPLPDAALVGQSTAYYTAKGAAETVLSNLIAANYWRLYTGNLYEMAVVPSQGRGATVSLNERFSNLAQVVSDKAALADLGVSVGLVQANPKSTRAELTCSFYQPQDHSMRVRLSTSTGTLRSWTKSDDVPTATRAIVAGGGKGTARMFRQVTADTAEADWGRRREVFVDQRDSTDPDYLIEQGTSELADATGQASLEIEAADSEGIAFGTHYNVGDLITRDIFGDRVVQRLGGAVIDAGSDGVTVQLRPGNPDGSSPLLSTSRLVRHINRRVRALEANES